MRIVAIPCSTSESPANRCSFCWLCDLAAIVGITRAVDLFRRLSQVGIYIGRGCYSCYSRQATSSVVYWMRELIDLTIASTMLFYNECDGFSSRHLLL
jgi:hypothetical protein